MHATTKNVFYFCFSVVHIQILFQSVTVHVINFVYFRMYCLLETTVLSISKCNFVFSLVT